ncbi:MAG: urease accessory protein UreF [Chitinophagaceae bacterium]
MNSALLRLLHITDPSLPIGSYSHSGGLETYVQLGLVKDGLSAKTFVTEMLCNNIQYTDAAFLSLAFDAALEKDIAKLLVLDAECSAVKLPEEIRSASVKLGKRLLKLFDPLCGNEITLFYKNAIEAGEAHGHYCILFGLYTHAMQVKKEESLTGFYYNAAAGYITNCVKLVPLGQQEGQEILFSLQPVIEKLVMASLQPDLALLGLCSPGLDIRCMQHEQLYSRLYMS